MEKKVLIVDDDDSIRDSFYEFLTESGYKVYTAANAEKALELLENEKNINVMFLDLKMPGKNGLELCREIRSNNPIACMFAITGFSSIFDLSDARDAGFDDYFIKPVDVNLFLTCVEDAFKKLDRWRKKQKV